MPSPQFALKGRATDPGVTNVRNTASPHWRRWLGPANRCLVPFTSFSEYETAPDKKKIPVWFAFDESRPLAAFAGIWTNWTSVRKAKEGEVTCDLYAFLTTDANADVAPIYPKAMPVILTTDEEFDIWLRRQRQRPWRYSGRCRTASSGSLREAQGKTASKNNSGSAVERNRYPRSYPKRKSRRRDAPAFFF